MNWFQKSVSRLAPSQNLAAKWVMTHPNGSHIEGYVVKPEDMDDYAQYRDIGPYCPFPEGVWSSIRARDAEGVGIINEIGVIWARHIGRPLSVQAAGQSIH